jgi:cytochrome P450
MAIVERVVPQGAHRMSLTNQDVYFNPSDAAFRANPYPHYRALYGRPPYLMNLLIPMTLVARYADAVTILRDHERFSSVPLRVPGFEEYQDPSNDEMETMLFSDPPRHTRLRRSVSRAFTPRRIKDLEPRICEITDMLLDHAARKGDLEVVADLATPLPVMVIAEMLGVPAQQYEQFKHWCEKIIEADNTPYGIPISEDVREAFSDLRKYLADTIESRRKNPGTDLISAVITAQDGSEVRSAEELREFLILLLLAGNETTTNLIGNGMLALGRHPDELARLRSEPALLPRAIEEMLRYDGPVQTVALRHNNQPVNVGGTEIPSGTAVFVIVAAADRDPAQFSNPDVFDITRAPNDHLAFGDGVHHCLGAALARSEAAIAFGSMLERFPRLRLADTAAALKYKASYFLRGLVSLRMAIT